MRNVLILVLLTTCLASYGQVSDSLKGKGTKIRLDGPSSISPNHPLYLISLDGQIVEMKGTELSIDSLKINPEWILSLHVFKGQDALDKYGERALNGAILIELKKESADKIPPGLKRRFIAYKN